MRRRFVVLPLVLLAVVPGAARAAVFPAPVELEHGSYLGAAAATDASGSGVVVVTGADGGPELFERPAGAAVFGAAQRLSGSVKGPVVAAAGAGAAVVAWRGDQPRRYQSIGALVRDPGGGSWSDPVTVSDGGANGVRHPAVAVDAAGRAVLAYNSNTRASHLSMMGAVSVALRGPGQGFGRAIVVDAVPRAAAPAVAIGPDGRGLVAWIRNRRIWGVDVDAVSGTVGRTKALSRLGRWGLLHVAAGPGGGATIVARGVAGTDTALYAVRRPAGAAFAGRAFQVLERFARKSATFVQDVAVAADEAGRTTVVWSPERFGRASGFTSGITIAVAAAGKASFGAPHALVPAKTTLNCFSPTVAASAGRSALGWVCSNRKTYTFQTALTNTYNITGPTTVATGPGLPLSYASQPTTIATLDATGETTLILTRPDVLEPATPTTTHILTTTGR